MIFPAHGRDTCRMYEKFKSNFANFQFYNTKTVRNNPLFTGGSIEIQGYDIHF